MSLDTGERCGQSERGRGQVANLPFCKASLDDWMVRLDTCEGILSAGYWGCVEGEFSGIKVGFRSLMGGVVAGWLFELTVR